MIVSRRNFMKDSALLCSLSPFAQTSLAGSLHADELLTEARYYEKLPHRKIKCNLCPRHCAIDDQERGYCGVRENREGTYYTLVHSRPCTAHVDPIEKKPLFHFHPGSLAFSIATVGCNVECKFCQNWQISQIRPEQIDNLELTPEQIVRLAQKSHSRSIAYTYTEPVIFTEYMYDCAACGNENGIKSVMISNGYICETPMRDLVKVLHAVKIDLKAFTEKFYQYLVAGELKPVLDTLVLLKEMNVWTEIVYLIIPTHNDAPGELQDMCKWIVRNLGANVPIHFTRFYPQYRMKNLPPTPVSTLVNARKIALETGLNYAYVGNIPGHPGESTVCPHCNEVLIKRAGYSIIENNMVDTKCPKCNTPIAGFWK